MFDLRRWLRGFQSDIGGPPRDIELLKEGLSRRGLLGLFAGAAAAVVIDPERALWVPGKKLISIPNPSNAEILAAVNEITKQQQFIINSFRDVIYCDCDMIYCDNALEVADFPIYDTITLARPQRRNGLLVPRYAGGNACS
jgi:hypothetical protein